MTRDFAFVVPRDVAAGDIVRAAQGAERQLIAGIDVFDVYEGAGIDPDKKSVAIAVTLQPTEKTLTDAEIDAVSQKIVAEVAKRTGAVLRQGDLALRRPLPAGIGISKEAGWIGGIRARGIRQARARGGPRPQMKGERVSLLMDLSARAPVGGAAPRFSRPGLIGRDASSCLDHRSSGPSAGAAPCGSDLRVPLAPYGRARLVVAGGRMSSGFLVRRLTEPFGTALQSRRPPESDATERPPRDRLPPPA